MDNEKKNIEKEGAAAGRPGADVDSVIKQLMGIDSMFQDFINAETEGMIICENCYDNVFDDDENICTLEEDGVEHRFCCRECMEEWKEWQEREIERHA